jgi:DNA-binding XRE family transcriptional regulator
MAEQRTFNPKRVGSSPTGPTNETLGHQGLRRPDSVLPHGSNPIRLRTGCSSDVPTESDGVAVYAWTMVEWLSSSGMFNYACRDCGVPRLDHDNDAVGHGWIWTIDVSDDDYIFMTMAKTLERERRGDYDAPLPPPAERRRIREAVGWTQQQVADELHVSRHTIGRFEKKAGLVNGRRMSGREPSRELRVAYSALLKSLLEDGG